MALAVVYSRACSGIQAPLVIVETHLSNGMPSLNIVGLAETTVKESRDRVRSALINSGFDFPRRRITINLAPADFPKEGGRFDLPIAISILAASGQIPSVLLQELEFIGELALTGELRAIPGTLPSVLNAKKNARLLIIPSANKNEGKLVAGASVMLAGDLKSIVSFLRNTKTVDKSEFLITDTCKPLSHSTNLDLNEVRGQISAKRALEIAAAGGHSILLIGPPGTGKTMLATRFPTLLPDLTEEDAITAASLQSVSSQGFDVVNWRKVPFRAPHHSCSGIALVGGGRPPKPGEISLATNGVLFLDELPEFNRHALEALREPLESGVITLARAGYQITYPAYFQLIAAMNPCPCGFFGSSSQICHCTPDQIRRYFSKISGPLWDRIDMHIEVRAVPDESLWETATSASASSVIKQKVMGVLETQRIRQHKKNAALSSNEILIHCDLETSAKNLLSKLMKQFHLSTRSYHRILKVARTIADLSESSKVLSSHLSEAILFRMLDRYKLFSNSRNV